MAPTHEEDRRSLGVAMMRRTLGAAYVDARDKTTNNFNAPLRAFSEEACYGTLWTRDALAPKIRSLMCLGMLTALNRPHEIATHVRGALNTGCSVEEIQEALLHTVAYCGLPATIDAFRVVERVLAEEGHTEVLKPLNES